jgi:hypothetical protein
VFSILLWLSYYLGLEICWVLYDCEIYDWWNWVKYGFTDWVKCDYYELVKTDWNNFRKELVSATSNLKPFDAGICFLLIIFNNWWIFEFF